MREDLTPFEKLLYDDAYTSTPQVYSETCYICNDPDFAQMGLPLCRSCVHCEKSGDTERGRGHIPADDEQCTVCGTIEVEEDYT